MGHILMGVMFKAYFVSYDLFFLFLSFCFQKTKQKQQLCCLMGTAHIFGTVSVNKYILIYIIF